MSNLKKFKVSDFSGDEVVIEVDLDVLSPSLAKEINGFFVFSDKRLELVDGDAVRAVLLMFGNDAVRYFLHDGGIWLSGPIGDDNVKVTKDVLDFIGEGWPDFENLGIVIFSACVHAPTIGDFNLEEI
jgi:hypothetical protein